MAGKGVEYTSDMQDILVNEWIESGEAATAWCAADRDNRPHYNTFKNWPAVIAHRASQGASGVKPVRSSSPKAKSTPSYKAVEAVSPFYAMFEEEYEAKKAEAYAKWLTDNQSSLKQRMIDKATIEADAALAAELAKTTQNDDIAPFESKGYLPEE